MMLRGEEQEICGQDSGTTCILTLLQVHFVKISNSLKNSLKIKKQLVRGIRTTRACMRKYTEYFYFYHKKIKRSRDRSRKTRVILKKKNQYPKYG